MLFDIVIANPMWNQKEWSRESFERGDPYGRAKYGIPPKSSGDWMWVQHMLATLNHNGRLGVVLDNGALFRGQREGKVRRAIVEHYLWIGWNCYKIKLCFSYLKNYSNNTRVIDFNWINFLV